MAAAFEFTQGSQRLDWGVLVAIDLQRLVKDTNVDTLQRVVENLAFARVTRDEAAMFTPEHIIHLLTLCQLVMQYLVYSQECLAKINVRLSDRVQELQQRCTTTDSEREKLHEENAVLRKEVKAQRRTLMAYEFAKSSHNMGSGNALPYVCPNCGEAYAKNESLQSHIRKRHARQTSASMSPQAQQTQETSAAQHTEMRVLLDKVDRLERQLEREKEGNDRMQRESMMMMLQATLNNRGSGSAGEQNQQQQQQQVSQPSPLRDPPPQQQQQQQQQTPPPPARAHSPLVCVPPELSAVPVMPDFEALQRYNLSRQQETANNALLRQITELERAVRDLKSGKRAEEPAGQHTPSWLTVKSSQPPQQQRIDEAQTSVIVQPQTQSQTQSLPFQQQQSFSVPQPTPQIQTQPQVLAPPQTQPIAPPTAVPQPTAPPAAVPQPIAPPTAVPQPTAPPAAVPQPIAPPTAVPQPTAPPAAVPQPIAPPTAAPQLLAQQPYQPQPQSLAVPQPQPQPGSFSLPQPPSQTSPSTASHLPAQQPQQTPVHVAALPLPSQTAPLPQAFSTIVSPPPRTSSMTSNSTISSFHAHNSTQHPPAPSVLTAQPPNVSAPPAQAAAPAPTPNELLAKYGPPGPALVPWNLPNPSQSTAAAATITAGPSGVSVPTAPSMSASTVPEWLRRSMSSHDSSSKDINTIATSAPKPLASIGGTRGVVPLPASRFGPTGPAPVPVPVPLSTSPSGGMGGLHVPGLTTMTNAPIVPRPAVHSFTPSGGRRGEALETTSSSDEE